MKVLTRLFGITSSFVLKRCLCMEVNLGIQKIGDLISATNSILYNYANRLATAEQRFFLIRVLSSIPTKWRALVKASTDAIVIDPIPSTSTIMMGKGDIQLQFLMFLLRNLSNFCWTKAYIAQCQAKLTDKYCNTVIEWAIVYSLCPFASLYNLRLESLKGQCHEEFCHF